MDRLALGQHSKPSAMAGGASAFPQPTSAVPSGAGFKKPNARSAGGHHRRVRSHINEDFKQILNKQFEESIADAPMPAQP